MVNLDVACEFVTEHRREGSLFFWGGKAEMWLRETGTLEFKRRNQESGRIRAVVRNAFSEVAVVRGS